MALPIIEIAGILLIIVGLVLIFLKLSGILTAEDAGGEISSKLFTLKGGTGLVLIALGIIVLMGGYYLEKPTQPFPTPTPTTVPTLTPAPAQTLTPTPVQTLTPTPLQTFTPVPTPPMITESYLIGTWDSDQGSITETVEFYSDGSFYLEDYNIFTTDSVYVTGFYYVSDSTLFLETSGVTTPYSIIYVDRDTFSIGANLYYRVV